MATSAELVATKFELIKWMFAMQFGFAALILGVLTFPPCPPRSRAALRGGALRSCPGPRGKMRGRAGHVAGGGARAFARIVHADPSDHGLAASRPFLIDRGRRSPVPMSPRPARRLGSPFAYAGPACRRRGAGPRRAQGAGWVEAWRRDARVPRASMRECRRSRRTGVGLTGGGGRRGLALGHVGAQRFGHAGIDRGRLVLGHHALDPERGDLRAVARALLGPGFEGLVVQHL